MDADMYRSGLGKVSASKGCIVEDRGALRHASRSGGAYLFSDTEVGALPLVLLGTENAMSEWLLNNKHCRIENRIEDLPDIYIGVTRYRPGSRFRAISPVGDTATEVAKQLTGFGLAMYPGMGAGTAYKAIRGVFKEVPDAIANLFDNLGWLAKKKKMISWKERGPAKIKGEATKWYVRFAYIEESGMEKVATGKLTFPVLYTYLNLHYNLFV
jgi:hypothetical protein